MKKFLLISCVSFFTATCFAQNFGFWASAAGLTANSSFNYYNTFDSTDNNKIGALNFIGSLGSFQQNTNSLQLNGGKMKTFKNSNSNVCGARIFFTTYPEGNRPASPVFDSVNFDFISNCSSGTFPNDNSACGDGDQQWGAVPNAGTDLTNKDPGNYVLEVYYRISGAYNSTSDCSDTVYDNNANPLTNYHVTYSITATTVPVCLVNCSIAYSQLGTTLKWTTTNELNTKNFVVERSTDGKSFVAVSTITAKGSLNATNNYSFSDNDLPTSNKIYYRLKTVDRDNKYSYSTIMPVSITEDKNNNIVHLTSTQLCIYNTSAIANGSLKLLDISGRVIISEKVISLASGGTMAIQLKQTINPGIYMVSIDKGAGNIITRKTIVTN
ncbi:hypothetical protein [Ferruginibacter albus]|uniref:hypothetical protein n=1 Tax=Ferruginibacter albus TaxID=2875540 RepID=UPI001CC4B0E9|nr:hypothetical protein [Ferruginibacter albus]UAY52960.1 hypothetical protein K9M53_04595 [Ferruginibacter albus]